MALALSAQTPWVQLVSHVSACWLTGLGFRHTPTRYLAGMISWNACKLLVILWWCSCPMELKRLEHYCSSLLQLYWHPYGFAALYDVCTWLQTLYLVALQQTQLCHAVWMVSGTCLP